MRTLPYLSSVLFSLLTAVASAQPPRPPDEAPSDRDTVEADDARVDAPAEQQTDADVPEPVAASTLAPPIETPPPAATTPTEPAPEEPPTPPPWGIELGPIRFAPSAEVWFRGEGRVDRPNGGGTEEYFVSSRIRLGLEARWSITRAFVQVQDARTFGQYGPGVNTGDTTTFHQGYLQVGGDDLFARVGRQEYLIGTQRMIGISPWGNAGRSFDAVRFHGKTGSVEGDVLGAWVRWHRSIADPTAPTPTNVESEGDYLGIGRLAWAAMPEITLEPYVLFRHDGPTEPPAGTMNPAPYLTRERNIANFGVHASGTFAEVASYDVEGMLQAGRANGSDHAAAALAGSVTLKLGTEAGMSTTVGAAYGSGSSPDGSIDELDNFFPTNHGFYGFSDYFGLRNMAEGWARFAVEPVAIHGLKTWVDAHLFAFPEPTARWTNANGLEIAPADPTLTESLAGGEIDIEAHWAPVDVFFLWAGYSIFVPAAGAQARGVTDPAHWMYLEVGVNLQ